MKLKIKKIEFIKSFGALTLLALTITFASNNSGASDGTLLPSVAKNAQDSQYLFLFSSELAPQASVAFGDFGEWFKNPLGNTPAVKLKKITNNKTSLNDPQKINLKGIISNSPYLYLEGETLYYNNNAKNPSKFRLIVEAFDPYSGIAEISGSRAFGDNPASHIYPYTLDYSIEKDSICPESKITIYATSGSGVTNTKEINCVLDGNGPSNGSISYPDGFRNNPIINIDVNPGTDAVSGMSKNAEDYLLEYKSAPLENGACGEFGEWKDTGINEITETGNYSFKGQNATCYQFHYSAKDQLSNESVYTNGAIIKVDTSASVLDSISINKSAEITNESTVTLTLSAKDAYMGRTMMQLSCNHQIWAGMEPFVAEKQFDLTSFPDAGCNENEGKKTVYARFSNKDGKWEDVVSDSIFYSKNNTWIGNEKPEPKNREIWEEGGMADQFMPEMELPELRDAFTKHFKLPNGSMVAAISSVPVHYEEDGQWKEVITDFEPNNTGKHMEYEYATVNNTVKHFTPAKSGTKGRLTDFGADGIYKSWINPEMRLLDNKDKPISNLSGLEVQGVADANRMIFSNIFKDTDVIFTQGIISTTMDIVLNSEKALEDIPKDADKIAYCEDVTIPNGWTYKTQTDPANPDKITAVIFSDSLERDALIYPQPEIYEKNNPEKIILGEYGITKNNDSITVCKEAPIDWLTSPERKFPVIVDPTEYLGAAYQTGTNYWSGTIGLTSNTKWDYDVDVGCWVDPLIVPAQTCPTNVEWRRGFAFFPIGSIMDGSDVTTAYVRLHSWDLSSSQTIYAYPLSSTYPTSTGASIETDCTDDTLFDYFTISAKNYYHYFCLAGTCSTSSGDNSDGSPYNSIGETTLQSELAAGTYWGACFKRSTETSGLGLNLVRFDQWNDATTSYRPMMYVVYTTPTITISNVTTPYLTGSYYYFTDGTSISYSGPNVGSPSTCYGHIDADTTYGGSIGSNSLGYDCTGTVSGPTCTDSTIYNGCIYACDDNGACANYSCDSTTRLRCDDSNPSGTFSITPTYYGPNTYSTTTSIAGTGYDAYSGVDYTDVRIYRNDGYWWNGTDWVGAATPVVATGTTSWYYSGIDEGSYTNGYTYEVYPVVHDKVGNLAATSAEMDSFTWDSAGPTTPGAPTTSWVGDHYVNTSFTASTTGSTDALSGMRGYRMCRSADNSSGCSYWTANGEHSGTSEVVSGADLPSDGTYRYYYWYAYDNLSNQSTLSGGTYIRMDTSPPTQPTMTAEPTWSQGTSNTVYTGGSTDSGVGGVQYNFCINTSNTTTGCTASGWTSNTYYSFSGLTDGQIYYYFVQAKDSFNNTTSWSASTSSTQDAVTPSVATPTIYGGTSYNNMWFKGRISLRSAISDGGSGLQSSSCEVSINSGGWTPIGVDPYLSQDANYCYYNSYTPNANFTIQLRVRDNAGNWGGTLLRNYYYDATAPYLSSQTGYGTGWYTFPQTSYFNYTDDGVGISSGNPASCEITTNGTSSTCSVTPNVCDYLGNCNTTLVTSNPIKLDDVHPTLTFNGVSEISDYIYFSGSAIYYNNAVPSGQSFTMDYNLTDNLSGDLQGAYYIAGETAFGTHPTAGTPFDISYTIDNAETCDGVLTTVGYDYAMNDSNPDGVACTLDTAAPTSNSISINSGATYTSSATVTLTLGSTDSGSGLSQMQFSCDNSNWTTPETFNTPKSFNITNQSGAGCSTDQGLKTVYVKFKDNVNNWTTTTISDTITYDTVAPTVTINQAGGQADPTNASSINFTVVFSESTTNFTTGDVTIGGTAGATTATVTGSGTTYNVAVSGMTVNGTVIPTIAAGVATDGAGNGNTASTSTDNTVTYDTVAPTVTINQAGGQADPTNASPIAFQVVFSESVTGFTTGDVTLSGTAGATSAGVSGSGTTYNVSVSGMTGDGTVIATIDATKAQDAAGNWNTASTSTDNTVTYDTTPPGTFSTTGPSSPTNDTTPNITWGASSGASYYDVKVSTDSVCGTIVAAGYGVTGTSWTVSPALSHGVSYYVCIRAYDAATNYRDSSSNGSFIFAVDTVAPTVALTYSENPANAGTVTITATYSENVNTAETPLISINQPGTTDISNATMTIGANRSIWTYVYTVNTANGSTYVDGTATVSLSTTHDQAGNTAAAPTGATFIIDTTPPPAPTLTCTNYTHDTWQATNPSTTCTITDTATPSTRTATAYSTNGGSSWTDNSNLLSFTFTPTANATTNVIMQISDTGGGPTNSNTYIIKTDSTAPSGGSTTYNNGYETDTTITVNVNRGTDPLSGLSTTDSDYYLEYRSIGLSGGVCGTFIDNWADAGVTENDTAVSYNFTATNGNCYQFRYTVKDTVGNTVLYTGTDTTKVSILAPDITVCAISEGTNQQYQYQTGTTLYYNSTYTGDFSVNVTADDPEAGIDYVNFPYLAAGFTPSTPAGTDDDTVPYSQTYAWSTASTTSPGAKDATVYSNSGRSSLCGFTVNRDVTAPSTGSISYTTQYLTSTASKAALTVSDGTDVGGSGVNISTRILERASASLDNFDGSCDTFGGYTPTTYTGTYPDIEDAGSVTDATCYKYRWRVSDNVGNQATYTSASEVKYDSTQPTAPTPSVSETSDNIYYAGGLQTLYYKTPASNQTFNLSATPEDPQSGIERVTFPGLSATITPATDTADLVSPYAVNYTVTTSANTSPGLKTLISRNNALLTNSANFTVTADLEAPTGSSVTCTSSYDIDGSFNVTGASGSDALSGIDTLASFFQRKDGTISDNVCDYGLNNFENVGTANAVNLAQNLLTGCYEYRYYSVDRVGNSTTSSTCTVKVDTSAPDITVADVSETSNYIYYDGSTLYYTSVPATPGSFTIQAFAEDTDTGITSVSGSTEFGDTTPTDTYPPNDDPYYALPYSIEQSATCTTPITVTATANSGAANIADVICAPDTAGPLNGSTTYTNGYENTTDIIVNVDPGTDAGSGLSILDTDYYLEYNEAPLTGGSCDSYTGWTNSGVSESASASQYSFSGTADKCYQFRYTVSDNVYNPATFTGTDTVKIDTTPPTITSITSVAGDTTPPYYDITNDSSTSIVFVTSDTTSSVAACKWDTSDTDYASMTDTCISPTNCVVDLSGDGVKNVYIRCIDAAGNPMTASEEVTYTIYSTPPVVTDANISIAGGTGTGGAYIVGDTVTVTWDNSALGDDNTDLTVDPTANLSGWGGSSTAAMTDTTACGGTADDDIWEACFTLVTGTIDNTNVHAAVTATNMAGPTTGNDTTNATVDNQPPDITANGTLTITTDNGVVGVAALNNGTSNQDKVTQSAVTLALPDTDTTTINLTGLTGQATLAATTQSGVVISGALDNAAQTFTITVTDNAGNTDTIVSDAISVDNIPPTVTASAISVTGASGAGGTFINGDTAAGRWDDSATGDNNSDPITAVIFNLSDWISTAVSISGTNNSDIWTTDEQSPLDSQSTINNNAAVTVTDNGGNQTTATGTNNYTIETLATDPATSSFTATPTSVMADGISTSLLTATLRDVNSDPVAGAVVSIDVTGATVRAVNCQTSDVGVVTKGRSNANGQACFLAVSSTLADNLEFTATDTTNSVEITEKAYVDYINCLIDPVVSTFAASKAQVNTDGLDYADLDLHLVDYCGFDIDATDIVTLDDSSTADVSYTPPGAAEPQTYSTSGGGLLTVAVSSLTSGLFTFDAGFSAPKYDITTYAEDPSIPNEYNGSGSLIAGSNNQDNTQIAFVMPFDFSLYGQTVPAGNQIYLCTNGFLSLQSQSCTTTGNLTGAIAGYHMDLTTNNGGIFQRSDANSITFVFDAQTKNLEDVNFEIKLYSNDRIEIHYDGEIDTVTTPFIGLYDFVQSPDASGLSANYSNKATAFEYSAPVTAFDLNEHPEIEFLAGSPNVGNSSVIAYPDVVTANGSDYSTITVTVKDDNNNPVPNRDIQLDQDGEAVITQVDCDDLVTPAPGAPTDEYGEACFNATDAVAQTVVFTATDITDLPIILGSDSVDYGCVVGAGQQCVQVSVEAGTGTITMTAPSDFTFLPASSGVFDQEQFTCDDPTVCPDNATGYNHNVDDILTVTDTRNNGGFTVQLQASTPFERADNIYLPFQNFFAATTPASTGGTVIGGIEYGLNYSGLTCSGTPLNTAGSLLNAASFTYNFGSENTIPSTIHDLMQCDLNPGQGRDTTMKQNVNYHLLLPALQPAGLYQVTLTYDLVI